MPLIILCGNLCSGIPFINNNKEKVKDQKNYMIILKKRNMM
jgi:hypothetical protein